MDVKFLRLHEIMHCHFSCVCLKSLVIMIIICIVGSSGNFTVFKATDKNNIELYSGDIYNCSPDALGGQFDAIWDCNAMVAINPEDREKYSDTLMALLKPNGRILLTTYEYDQKLKCTFPHTVSEVTVVSLFERKCSVVALKTSMDLKDTPFLLKFDLPWANRLIFYIQK